MNTSIEGKVVGVNEVQAEGRIISCWENAMQAAVTPQPLDLKEYMGREVEVSGHLLGDLWSARFERVVEDGHQSITGEVIGTNVIQGPDGPVSCYRNGMVEAKFSRLDLIEYFGATITVSGVLHGESLYRAQIVSVPAVPLQNDPAKEAKSLNDLMRIREANRERIEAVNGNLGTALGYKWTNGHRTNHPCVMIFVPQKTAPWLVPEEEEAPELLEGPDGLWCLTDVVTGGKAGSLAETDPPPELSDENKTAIQELRSGRIGLVGGIQLAFFEDGIQDGDHAFVGTAGIAVRHRETGRAGLLTNQHVADGPGRRIYHPRHLRFPIGVTQSTQQYMTDEDWYGGAVDESESYVRCDCGFIAVDEHLEEFVRPEQHLIGRTGDLLRIDAETMNIIGQRVIGIGRTRGLQRGTVAAFAYEFNDDAYSIYTDLLIIGEDGNAFSDKGDSGKVIVTDDDKHRPVALLWGGWQERLRRNHEQENWTYAIDLGKVLELLGLDLLV